MTQQAELYRRIDTLPQKFFGEVIDFVGYLEHKAKQEIKPIKPAAKDNNGKIKLTKEFIDELLADETLRSLTGILHTDMTIDEIRDERLAKHL